ncbi:MAG: phage head closure protein [Planctomycetaceae bacterium]
MDVAIGSLRFRIHILAPGTPVRDEATGEQTVAWTAIGEAIPAAYQPSSDESQKANKNTDVVTAVFTIRWRSDVTSQCRVEHNGRTFEIKGSPIDPDGRRRWLVITAVSTE